MAYPLLGPMGSLSSSFIPAVRLRTGPLSPRASSSSDRSAPSRVRFAASRPGPLRADLERERDWELFGLSPRPEEVS